MHGTDAAWAEHMGKYYTASVKLEQAYIRNVRTIYIYIYTVTAEAFLQVWGSLMLTPIIIVKGREYWTFPQCSKLDVCEK